MHCLNKNRCFITVSAGKNRPRLCSHLGLTSVLLKQNICFPCNHIGLYFVNLVAHQSSSYMVNVLIVRQILCVQGKIATSAVSPLPVRDLSPWPCGHVVYWVKLGRVVSWEWYLAVWSTEWDLAVWSAESDTWPYGQLGETWICGQLSETLPCGQVNETWPCGQLSETWPWCQLFKARPYGPLIVTWPCGRSVDCDLAMWSAEGDLNMRSREPQTPKLTMTSNVNSLTTYWRQNCLN